MKNHTKVCSYHNGIKLEINNRGGGKLETFQTGEEETHTGKKTQIFLMKSKLNAASSKFEGCRERNQWWGDLPHCTGDLGKKKHLSQQSV